MSSQNQSKSWFAVLLVFCLLTALSTTASADDPILELRVGNTAGIQGQTDVKLPIYITNPYDSVAGFTILIQMDRPDVASFQLDIDTVGTLISGWETILTSWWEPNGYILKVVCLCTAIGPFEQCSFPPSAEEALLMNLLVTMDSDPPLLGDPYCQVFINPMPEQFNFSDPWGSVVALSYQDAIDTSYYVCTSWDGPDCLSWQQVVSPPADSIFVDTTSRPFYDFGNTIILDDGSFIFGSEVCGDIDGTFDSIVDVADLTRMINYLFVTFEPLLLPEYGNVDQSPNGDIDIGDLSEVINFLFIDFQPLSCP